MLPFSSLYAVDRLFRSVVTQVVLRTYLWLRSSRIPKEVQIIFKALISGMGTLQY